MENTDYAIESLVGKLLAYHLRDACRQHVVLTPRHQLSMDTREDRVLEISMDIDRHGEPLDTYLVRAAREVAPLVERSSARRVRVSVRFEGDVFTHSPGTRGVLFLRCGRAGGAIRICVSTVWPLKPPIVLAHGNY